MFNLEVSHRTTKKNNTKSQIMRRTSDLICLFNIKSCVGSIWDRTTWYRNRQLIMNCKPSGRSLRHLEHQKNGEKNVNSHQNGREKEQTADTQQNPAPVKGESILSVYLPYY